LLNPRSGVNAVFGLALLVARTWIGLTSCVVPFASRPVPVSTSATVSAAFPAVLVSSAVTDAS
jgi:hypothetical protein